MVIRLSLSFTILFLSLGCEPSSVEFNGDQNTWSIHLLPSSVSPDNGGYLVISSVKIIDSGDIVVVGETGSAEDARAIPCVIKLDSTGHILWARGISFPVSYERMYFGHVIEVLGGDVFVLFDDIDNDGVLVKIDENGESLSGVSMGRSELQSLHTTSDEELVILSKNDEVMYITKLDRELNVLWDRLYNNIRFSSLFVASNGDIIAYGLNTFGDVLQVGPHFVSRFDHEGQVIWARQYQEQIESLVETSSGEFVASGSVITPSGAGSDGWVGVLNSEGDYLWSRIRGDQADGGPLHQAYESFSHALALPGGQNFALLGRGSGGEIPSHFLSTLNIETGQIEGARTIDAPNGVMGFAAFGDRVAAVGRFDATGLWPNVDWASFLTVSNAEFEIDGGCSQFEARSVPELREPDEVFPPTEVELVAVESTVSLIPIEISSRDLAVEAIYRCPEG